MVFVTENDSTYFIWFYNRTQQVGQHTFYWPLFSAHKTAISRSQWPRGLRRRSAAERLLGASVRITHGAWTFVSCTVFVLSGRGLCDGPIPRPEESYLLWCVFECDQVKIKTLYTCCEQVGRRGKDCETKRRQPTWSHNKNCKLQTPYVAGRRYPPFTSVNTLEMYIKMLNIVYV
jgi:hypothetical protein